MNYKILIIIGLGLGLFACKPTPAHMHNPDNPNKETADDSKQPKVSFLSVVQKLQSVASIKDLVEGNPSGLKVCKTEIAEAASLKDLFIKNACVELSKFQKADIIFVLGSGILEDKIVKSSLFALNAQGDILSTIDVKVIYRDTLPLADANNSLMPHTNKIAVRGGEKQLLVENQLSTKITKEEIFFLQTDVQETNLHEKTPPRTHFEIQKVRFNYETKAFEEAK